MIDPDATVEVSQVGNGFILRIAGSRWFGNDEKDTRVWIGERSDYMVSNSLNGLLEFLEGHFSHRAPLVAVDA